MVLYHQQEEQSKKEAENFRKETDMIKGYSTENGYMGYVGSRYMLFASESDYRDYMED